MKCKQILNDLKMQLKKHEADIDVNNTDTTDDSNKSYPQRKTKLQMRTPAISISLDLDQEIPTESDIPPSTTHRALIIPTLTIEQPSPTRDRSKINMFPGSPPPQRASIGETSFMFPNKQQQIK